MSHFLCFFILSMCSGLSKTHLLYTLQSLLTYNTKPSSFERIGKKTTALASINTYFYLRVVETANSIGFKMFVPCLVWKNKSAMKCILFLLSHAASSRLLLFISIVGLKRASYWTTRFVRSLYNIREPHFSHIGALPGLSTTIWLHWPGSELKTRSA